MKVKFGPYDCLVCFKQYRNGQTAIMLMAEKDDEELEVFQDCHVGTATVCIPEGIARNFDEVLIKEYSESAGMVEALLKAGVIEQEMTWFDFGHGRNPVEVDGPAAIARCRLTPSAKDLAVSQNFGV